jgi:hypothetical protein
MSASATLRLQIERTLEHRFPAALSPLPQTLETAPTGIQEIDDLLAGGLPVGAITEIAGPQSSGRTSMTLAFLARHTQEGHACAWIDSDDVFDPESAAASGVVLRQLLWVRCRAVSTTEKHKPWPRLEQAIRAADLLLQSGGFAAIVLDLAATAPEHASRIPLATWFRFRQAAARTRCSLVVLDRAPCAQSSAAAVLECTPLSVRAQGNTVLGGFNFAVRIGRSSAPPATTPGRWGSKPVSPADSGSKGGKKPPVAAWPAGCAWDTEKRA